MPGFNVHSDYSEHHRQLPLNSKTVRITGNSWFEPGTNTEHSAMKFRTTATNTLALAMLQRCSVQTASTQPNVLLIMTDDQGWGDISSHGAEHLQTPTLDAFAESGVRFDRFFVSPVLRSNARQPVDRALFTSNRRKSCHSRLGEHASR